MKYFMLITLLAVASPAFAYSSYNEPSGFALFLTVLTFVGALLNIILFFKIWGMTNNVKRIKEKMIPCNEETVGEQITRLHIMGKDDECERIILSKFYFNLKSELFAFKYRCYSDTKQYQALLEKPITPFTDVVEKLYQKIDREVPSHIKKLKTYGDFEKMKISNDDMSFPEIQ